jgi:hypothetical protein
MPLVLDDSRHSCKGGKDGVLSFPPASRRVDFWFSWNALHDCFGRHLGLLEHGLGCPVLFGGRVAIFPQHPLDHAPQVGANLLSYGPINRGVFPHGFGQFPGDGT